MFKKVISVQKQQQLKAGLLGMILLRAGGKDRSGAREKPLAGFQRKDVHSCCLLRQCRICDLKEEQLGAHHKPSSQRPRRTLADFRDTARKKIIHSRLGYLP